MRHAAGGVLEAQHQAALEMILGAAQLGVRHRRLLQPAQLLDAQIDDLGHRLVGAAGVDRDVAGVAIGAQAAEHRVGQAALLADVLEQPRAHRSAEHGVQDVADVAIVVALRIAVACRGRCGSARAPWSRTITCGTTRGAASCERLAASPAASRRRAATRSRTARVLDVAGRRDDQVAARRRRRRSSRAGSSAVNDSTVSLRAENRPAERMPFPEVLREELVDQIVGRVLDHLDLFEDDLLLAARSRRRRTPGAARCRRAGRPPAAGARRAP